ncbi:hypothetical protein ABOM_008398 [Aspergillus bombycis]|uniref:Integral membrane protein n=1 Tax=Aspergillus bombycis TaxID=109264 RepID=A0A1F7ZSI2_9EURO|nr:hypothetical protein ABOM_008398 [Aspergillus bombycis]OGM42377.1 hypothetical protein ABOM_008398 [Aspergillus bombycis]
MLPGRLVCGDRDQTPNERRKLKILCFLSAGTVVLITAIVRISITLWKPGQLNWNRWGMREMFIDIIAVYIPAFRAILRSSSQSRHSSVPSESSVAIMWPSSPYHRHLSLDLETASPTALTPVMSDLRS